MRPTRIFPFAQTALQNLFRKPVTTAYPFAPAQYPERMRGHVEIDIENCISCGLCARSCPPGALTVDRAARTWTINRFDCVQCGSCVNNCPKKCLRLVPGYTTPDTAKHSETFTRPAPPVGRCVVCALKDTFECICSKNGYTDKIMEYCSFFAPKEAEENG